jgi:hypothetical protein
MAEIYHLYLLRPGAHPRACDPLSFDEVVRHRHLGCRLYSDCLRFVAQSPWKGFSCDRCPLAALQRTG